MQLWTVLAGGILLAVSTACASARQMLTAGTQPSDVIGSWIDVANSTAADTAVRIFRADGRVRTLHINVESNADGKLVPRQREESSGFWFVTDWHPTSSARLLCVRERAREGATCTRFRVEAAMAEFARRRLMISEHAGDDQAGERVLLERLP